jgi:hypothetical protein
MTNPEPAWMKEFDERVISAALEAGFMLSTAYGQDASKLMPCSDSSTLKKFAQILLAENTKEVEERHEQIYRWLLGYEDFPQRGKLDGAYYWRNHLRSKLREHGIAFTLHGPTNRSTITHQEQES